MSLQEFRAQFGYLIETEPPPFHIEIGTAARQRSVGSVFRESRLVRRRLRPRYGRCTGGPARRPPDGRPEAEPAGTRTARGVAGGGRAPRAWARRRGAPRRPVPRVPAGPARVRSGRHEAGVLPRRAAGRTLFP